jgi:serine/threonine-protein kinase
MNEGGGPFGEEKGSVLHPGESFHGYIIEKQIGKGGLGTIWLGRHQMLETLFAIKVLDPEVAAEKPEYVKRFVREAKLATRIRHPNLVAVHDAGYDESRGVYFLVMDYVKGDTLRYTIAFGGAQPEKEAVRIIMQVADVLAAGQRFGMVHRDLKPENIMLTSEGTVKLLDFGIAKTSGGIDTFKTSAKTLFGTPAYISPEQAVDSSSVDARADVYSLGIILFELLCGRRPYAGNTPSEVLQQLLDPSPIPDVRTFNDKVSPKVSAVLSLMCAKKKEDRLASPKDVIDTFARLGYVLPPPSEPEFAVEEDSASAGMVQDLIPDVVATARRDRSLTLETQDKDVIEFLTKLRRKRMLKKVIWGALICAVLLLLVLAWRLFA